jgi:uncharacterized protein YecE (DUF72 family)
MHKRADTSPSAPPPPRIATAGWTIPRHVAAEFPSEGAGLQRYAARFGGVEINSTFYRSHRATTYARWAETTPADFRFALKLPRTITHEARLVDCVGLAAAFRAEVEPLGAKLGPLLVQLPPSLAFAPEIAAPFFAGLRELWPRAIVCEPRHASWFDGAADAMLAAHRIGRVGADPARHPAAGEPAGWRGISYWRLHGSPRMYYSAYEPAALDALAASIRTALGEVWCVFDNTTSGAAAADALALQARLEP